MTSLDRSVKVLVAGAGAMGSGIAHVAARAGHTVYLFDQNAEAVTRGKAAIEKDLRFLVSKGKLSEADCAETLARLLPTSRLDDARDAGLAIEAIVERLDAKQGLFRQLQGLLGPDAILATNTSSLSITAIGAVLERPERLAGMHFFNPAPRMALVEIVTGLATDPAVAACLLDTAKAWGKTTVMARSTPGFIVNRVARPYYGEALRVLAEGAAEPATLDAILREAGRFPMGPFELMDMIGHDVNFAVSHSVFDAYFGDKRFTPSLMQQELLLAGRLGRKSGRGFYDYAEGAVKPVAQAEPARQAATAIKAVGRLGIATALAERLAESGVAIEWVPSDEAGRFEIGEARLMLSDGRSATRRAAEEGFAQLVLFDLAFDYSTTPRIALSKADQCTTEALQRVVGTLQKAVPSVTCIDDVPGMLVLRTVCMLANEAADAVLQGVASAADVDTAMCYGTNYPRGPLAWADLLGLSDVVGVLRNLREHYGEERYRISPQMQRLALAGNVFCARIAR